MTELSFGQQSFLAQKIRDVMEVEPEKLWKMIETLDEKTYKFFLALSYNEPENLKYEVNKLL